MQPIPVALELGRNDRHAVPRLSKGQQGVWGPALEHDGRLQSCHSGRRVEGAAKSKSTVHQQQRKVRQVGNLDRATTAQLCRGVANCKQLH